MKTIDLALKYKPLVIVILSITIGFVNCTNKKPLKTDAELTTTAKIEYPMIPDSIKTDKLETVLYLTALYEEEVTDLIASNFSLNKLTNGKASIITEGEIVYAPLRGEMSVEGLQEMNNNIFEVECVKLQESEDSTIYHILRYKDSYIKVAHTKYEGWLNDEYLIIDDSGIICGVIEDKEIQLSASYIGSPKKEFFYTTLGLKIPLEIDTLEMGCTTGESQQQYIFSNDTLRKVRITSYSDLVDFQFHQ